ncbi:MAG: hypothetical protein KIT84_44175 [Labilithrix sp.]|nr:hypothetical protein [Labilithrix sp.]MCW5818077.1 hypothetical protein [Labilithrix sp.]
MDRRFVLASLVVLAACGGKQEAKTPASDAKEEEHESIGDVAAAQGGIAALGGAGNREQGTGTEVAFAGPLRLETLSKKNPPKLDGVPKEWHARAAAKEKIEGKTDDLGLDVAVQASDDTLWLAAEIADPSLKRSKSYADGEDHVRVVLAFPAGRGVLKAYEIGFWPGVPGSSPGAVKWISGPNAGQKVTGAKLVENDVKGGVTFEATVPWSSFAEAASTRVGLRATFRYHDDGGGVLATGPGGADKPNELLALPIAAEAAVVEGLLQQKGLAGTKPSIDIYADVAGDDRKERISVFGSFITICGPGYRGGKQFFWRELVGEIVTLETGAIVLGRPKEEVVLRRRVTQGQAVHELLELWSIPQGKEEPDSVFAHQVMVISSDGKKKVTNAVHLGAKQIEVTTEPATGWDAGSFKEPLAGNGVEPILLPWGAVKSKTFKIENGKVASATEVPQTPAAAPSTATASATLPKDVPTPAVTKPSDNSKAVMDAYMRDANVAAGTKPKFDLGVNVDGDATPERVALFGRDLVVLGPGFKGGSGYARLTLTQFNEDKDVGELTARDLDGDGAAELIVRGERHVKVEAQTVEIDALFVYQVKGGNIARVFSIETGREVSGKRVQGLVQFVPAKKGKGFDIDVRPGTAKGWTKESYPWPQDKPGSGAAIEPLLLPWGGVANVRYAWNGTQFAPAQ